jgi:hypothetical protein
MQLVYFHAANMNTVTCRVNYWWGFGLVIRFIGHLYTRLGTTSNYSATANLHNSQITTAPAKPFSSLSSLSVPWQRLLTVEILQFHALKFSLQNSRTTLSSKLVLSLYLGTDHIENTALLLLRSCLLVRESVYRAVAQKRPWHIRPSLGRCIAAALHATILCVTGPARLGTEGCNSRISCTEPGV